MLPQLRFDQPNFNYPHRLVQTLKQENSGDDPICKLAIFLVHSASNDNLSPLEATQLGR
jgi:hypothetical protein